MICRPVDGENIASHFKSYKYDDDLDYSIFCEACKVCWMSNGELPSLHKAIKTINVSLYTQNNDYCKYIVCVSCKRA